MSTLSTEKWKNEMKVEVLFFDVLGTVVDWRGSIAAEVQSFLQRHHLDHIDPAAFADAWVGRYDETVEPVRSGARSFIPLDIVNMENLEACLTEFKVSPAGISRDELEDLNRAWHRLNAWPDSVEGIAQLKQRFIVAPLSDGNTRLLINMAKRAALPWDTILGADIPKAYKPMPVVYLNTCALLEVEPEKSMLVAAHDYDLEAARQCGMKTAFIRRDHARDPSKAGTPVKSTGWDYIARDLKDLATKLL